MPYRDLLMVVSTVLRISRTLDGAEIDKMIWYVETRKAKAIERQGRAEWRKRLLSAASFQAECFAAKA